jgi:hypothetical protein
MELGKPFADVFKQELQAIEFRRIYLNLNDDQKRKAQVLTPLSLRAVMRFDDQERSRVLSLSPDLIEEYCALAWSARWFLRDGGDEGLKRFACLHVDRRKEFRSLGESELKRLREGKDEEWKLFASGHTIDYRRYAALPEDARQEFRKLDQKHLPIYLSIYDPKTRHAFAAAASDEDRWKSIGLENKEQWDTCVGLGLQEAGEYLRLSSTQRKKFKPDPTGQSRNPPAPPTPPAVEGPERDLGADEAALRRESLLKELTGMAISGGGIRSATFGLGVLQGLARLQLLSRFDYLSTVSGGGYIHGWLAAWIKREGDVENVEKQLDPSRVRQATAERTIVEPMSGHRTPVTSVLDEEPEPIFHLRSYSNYLTPRPGPFTADTWTLLTIYVRNFLINLLVLVPASMAVVVLSRFVSCFYGFDGQKAFTLELAGGYELGPLTIRAGWVPYWAIWTVLFAVSFLIAAIFVLVELAARKAAEQFPPAEQEPRFSGRNLAGVPLLLPFYWGLCRWIVWPIVFWGGAIATWYWVQPARPGIWAPFWERWPSQELPITGRVIVSGLFLASLLLGIWSIGLERANLQKSRIGYTPQKTLNLRSMLIKIVWPLVLACILAPWIFGTDESRAWSDIRGWGFWEDWPGTVQIVLAFAVPAGLLSLFFSFNSVLLGYLDLRGLLRLTFSGLAMGALAGLLLQTTLSVFVWPLANRPYVIAWIAPTLVILVLVAAGYLEVALSGDELSEYEREWRSRLGAFLFIHALAWLGVGLTTLLLPWGLEELGRRLPGIARWALTTSWVGTVLGAAWTASKTRDKRVRVKSGWWQKPLIVLGPPLFLVGLLASVSILVSFLLEAMVPAPDAAASFAERAVKAPASLLVVTFAGLVLLVLVMTLLIHVNLFSLHAMYGNRLTRCYLGASRPKPSWQERMAAGGWKPGVSGAPTNACPPDRRPNAISGFDPKDDFPVRELGVISGKQFGRPNYWGPYPLFNTTLNLITGSELAYQNRKSDSFVITPDHCGSRRTGFATLKGPPGEGVRPAARGRESDLLTLGRVIAISGAAVDPNMGLYQSASTTALLTIFNLRLGAWIENPRSEPDWEGRQPAYGQLLLSELLGKTDNQGNYVHLSDGGHFDNLGLYELVRRRCRYILAVDAAEDRGRTSDNLANAIRLCRRDFGVHIEIDTMKLAERGVTHLTEGHYAVGTIHYEDVDNGQQPGTLVYLKISMTGDEPSDLLEYHAKHQEFPHDPTLPDQFFDETQFECYRALGEHVASVALKAAGAELKLLDRQEAGQTPESDALAPAPAEEACAFI